MLLPHPLFLIQEVVGNAGQGWIEKETYRPGRLGKHFLRFPNPKCDGGR